MYLWRRWPAEVGYLSCGDDDEEEEEELEEW